MTAPDGGEPDLDRDRLRNFAGLALSRVGPRAFEVVHGTFLTLLVGSRTGSAFLAAFALTAHRLLSWAVLPVSGRLSDATRSRLGRRAPFLGGGLVIMGVATWLYPVVAGYWPLVGLILVARVANTARQVASIAVVPETFGRSRWLRALVATFLAGVVVSLSVRLTVIATWKESDRSTWAISFRMAAAFMVAAGIVVLLTIRDSRAAKKLAQRPVVSQPWRQRISEILAVPNARVLLAGLFLTVAATGATARLVPLFNKEELGAGAAEQSAALLVGAIAALVTSIPAGIWLTRRFKRRTLAVVAPLTASVGAAAHLFVTDIWQTVAIGLVTGAFATASFVVLISFYLQLLPRSGGMGERLGLSAGPFALVGVASTYVAGIAVDVSGSYRVMWLFPTALGLAQALVMTALVVPPWAEKAEMGRALRGLMSGARSRAGRTRDRSLFGGEVDVDDVDASVIFEVARHALGNPYVPPPGVYADEPARARQARRVVGLAAAPTPAEVAAVAELLDDDVTIVTPAGERAGQPAAIEELSTPLWEPHPGMQWVLVANGDTRDGITDGESDAIADGTVSFELSPPPPDGEVEVDVRFNHAGRVDRIERRVRPTLAERADAHARASGYPVPVTVDLGTPSRARRRLRLAVTLAVVVRHLGRKVLLRRLLRRRIDPADVARGLRRVFERLGGGYVKFGQLVASSPSLFGDDVSDEFRSTLDAGPVVGAREIKAVIAAELGRPFPELFASFDPDPIGCASIAVVHRATTVDGRAVAVKVIRPGIEESLATDLALMEPLFIRIAGPSAAQLAGPLLQMLQGFRRQISEELDLRNEAAAMAHYRTLLEEIELPDIVVPEPLTDLSSRRVLTMELLDGVAVDDLSAIEDFGFDPAPLLEQTVKGWFLTALLHGTFHGDVHAGNLMLLRDGRIGVIDWGIVGRLDAGTHRFFRYLIAGALGDEAAWDGIATYFADAFGPLLARGNLDPERLTELFRPRIEAILTQPFGQMSLGALITDNQRAAAEAEGETLEARRRRFRSRRAEARQGRGAEARQGRGAEARQGRGAGATSGPPPRVPPFNRGLFLLGKQLMYFERYGRMYLKDVSLLDDRDFFEALLARQPAPR